MGAVRFRNAIHYTLGALGPSGVLFGSKASESRGGAVHFRAFQALSTKLWTINLPERESCVAGCVCKDFICVGTSQRYVRLFSLGGGEKTIFCLPGTILNLTSKENTFTVIYAGSNGIQCK